MENLVKTAFYLALLGAIVVIGSRVIERVASRV